MLLKKNAPNLVHVWHALQGSNAHHRNKKLELSLCVHSAMALPFYFLYLQGEEDPFIFASYNIRAQKKEIMILWMWLR